MGVKRIGGRRGGGCSTAVFAVLVGRGKDAILESVDMFSYGSGNTFRNGLKSDGKGQKKM